MQFFSHHFKDNIVFFSGIYIIFWKNEIKSYNCSLKLMCYFSITLRFLYLWFSAVWLMFLCVVFFIFILLEAYRSSRICGFLISTGKYLLLYFLKMLSHVFSFLLLGLQLHNFKEVFLCLTCVLCSFFSWFLFCVCVSQFIDFLLTCLPAY